MCFSAFLCSFSTLHDFDHLCLLIFRFMNIEIVNELKKPSFSALKRQNPFIHLLDESKKLREQTTQVRFFYKINWLSWLRFLKPNYFKKLCSSSYLPEVDIQVQNDHWVLSRLVPCLKFSVLAWSVLNGHHIRQVKKNMMKKRFFLE